MILNKFRSDSILGSLKALFLQFLVLSLFSCSKTANSNINKSFLGVTHVAYGMGPVNLTLGVDSLLPFPLAYGETSGYPGNPYDTATAGIQDLTIYQGSTSLLTGNAAFQQGTHYSLFLFDTLNPQSLGLLILQDFQGDNISTYYRYLNFTPGSSLGLILTNARDTFTIGPSVFVGYNPQPTAYNFTGIKTHNGYYGVRAFYDSIHYNADSSNIKQVDSLQIDSTKVYNIFLQGFYNLSTGTNKLTLQSVQLN